jgi:AraC-like DNA-binding protein
MLPGSVLWFPPSGRSGCKVPDIRAEGCLHIAFILLFLSPIRSVLLSHHCFSFGGMIAFGRLIRMYTFEFRPDELFLTLSCIFLVLVSLCCALVRGVHMCRPYDRHPELHYPARRLIALAYLSPVMLLPAIVCWQSADAWLLVRTFFLYGIPAFAAMAFRHYFFIQVSHGKARFWLGEGLPFAALLTVFAFACIGGGTLAEWLVGWRLLLIPGVFLISGGYLLHATYHLWRSIRNYLYSEYSSEEFFPLRLARGIIYMPLFWMGTAWILYWVDSRILSAVYMILISMFSMVMMLVILHPLYGRTVENCIRGDGQGCVDDHGQTSLAPDSVMKSAAVCKVAAAGQSTDGADGVETPAENEQIERGLEETESRGLLSEERLDALEEQVRRVVEGQRLYLSPRLTMSEVARMLHTNRTYVSEVMRERFGSFYSYVNTLRIRCAEAHREAHPDATQKEIMAHSGFGSVKTYVRIKKLYDEGRL